MTFKDILAQVIGWLEQDKRITYRALKRQFDRDDAYLEDLKAAAQAHTIGTTIQDPRLPCYAAWTRGRIYGMCGDWELGILDPFLKEVAREDMMDFCRGRLGSFEWPRSVDFVAELPRQEDLRNTLRKDRRC
jgi:hypothetical protein